MKKIFFAFWFLILSGLVWGQTNELMSREKIFGLSKFWQEVNYNFIYQNKIDQSEWEKLFVEYIGKVQEAENDYEYYRLLQKFCAYLKDGHTNIYFPEPIRKHVFSNQFGDYRIALTNFEGKAIITRVNESKKNEIPIGSEFLKVNGVPVPQYLSENVYPYISSSTDYVLQDLGVKNMLQGYEGTSYEVELKLPNGDPKILTLTNSKSEENEFYPPIGKREQVEFRWLENDVVYVALNTFSEWDVVEEFKKKIPQLKKAKSLIIDLRKNGGGNSGIGEVILHYLSNDIVFYGSKSQSRQHIPTLKAWNRESYFYDFPYSPDTLGKGDQKLLKNKRVVIPTAILIGHGTASAAEDFLVLADNQNHMTKIGVETYGSTGQPLVFQLPGGGLGRVCTKKDTYPDGREFVGIGIKPDIRVEFTLSDFLEGKDPVLDKAKEFLKSR